VVAEYSEFDFLLPPERRILNELGDKLQGARILDLGVGAGRTAIHLAPRASRYVGIDVSRPMIEACERRFRGRFASDRVEFREGDVRDLRAIPDDSFDFVLFSFNGLDVVGRHAERLDALGEVARVCATGGMFCFSSHNLHAAHAGFSIISNVRALWNSRSSWKDKLRLLAQPRTVGSSIIHPLRWRRLNAGKSLQSVPYAHVIEERPRYEFIRGCYDAPAERIRVKKYYVRPDEQMEQLRRFGFGDVRVFQPDGEEITCQLASGMSRSWWLYYLTTAGPAFDDSKTLGVLD
jgi:SAM-dependent methyltransferase